MEQRPYIIVVEDEPTQRDLLVDYLGRQNWRVIGVAGGTQPRQRAEARVAGHGTAIDLRVTRLRRKIEHDPAHPDAIRTVRGVGCMFVPPRH